MILTSVHENKVGGWKLQSTLPCHRKDRLLLTKCKIHAIFVKGISQTGTELTGGVGGATAPLQFSCFSVNCASVR